VEVFSAEDSNAASPVLTLLPEITAESFFNFLPLTRNFRYIPGSSHHSFSVEFVDTGEFITLTTPALRKAISIVVCDQDAYETQKLELLKTWITRSGSCPLSLSIIGPPTSPIFPQFIETAMAHCKRWEQLDMLIPFDDLHLLQDEMPCCAT
jgi:hypothetical protein